MPRLLSHSTATPSAGRLGDHRRAGLETVRRGGVRAAGHGYRLDHLATTEERRQLGKEAVATP